LPTSNRAYYSAAESAWAYEVRRNTPGFAGAAPCPDAEEASLLLRNFWPLFSLSSPSETATSNPDI